ncbi:Digeranylgeranylglyceryl phosphate synthase [Candidatus Gugararchaeum adminiculabundum]|nr:Digeranylgeranylglyceryl phosphate synthase [Candidatus Gugararchaeum adminiculabundum]
MGSLKALWKLTRFEHALMFSAVVLIGLALAAERVPPLTQPIILALLAPMLAEVGIFALNDYLDIKTDKANKRTDRPLATGEISPGIAVALSAIGIIGALVSVYLISMPAFEFALFIAAISVLYNFKLKDLPLVGNMIVGFSMAAPLLFGSIVFFNSFFFSRLILILSAIAFIAGTAREIVKSIQDMEGDAKARKSKTLPIIIGAKNSALIAALLYITAIVLTPVLYAYGLKQTIPGIALITAADLIFLFLVLMILKSQDKSTLKVARKYSLLAFGLAILGVLLSVIF